MRYKEKNCQNPGTQRQRIIFGTGGGTNSLNGGGGVNNERNNNEGLGHQKTEGKGGHVRKPSKVRRKVEGDWSLHRVRWKHSFGGT